LDRSAALLGLALVLACSTDSKGRAQQVKGSDALPTATDAGIGPMDAPAAMDAAPPEAAPPDAGALPESSAPLVDRPIQFGDERKRLTIEYRRIH